jgi:hypothetical protein
MKSKISKELPAQIKQHILRLHCLYKHYIHLNYLPFIIKQIMSFGFVPKDISFQNVNVEKTLGQCNNNIRAQCIVANTIRANEIIAPQPQNIITGTYVPQIIFPNPGTNALTNSASIPSVGRYTVTNDLVVVFP